MTQSPQRGQTAPPSSEFGSVTTQRSAASDAGPDATTTADNGTDGRDTANWHNSPFAGGSAPGTSTSGPPEPGPSATEPSATTNPSLPTAPGAPSRPNGIGSASYLDGASSTASTGSLRTEQAAPPPSGAPMGAPPPTRAGAGSNNRAAKGNRSRGPRRARLQLRHVNPWTVLKFSCVLSIALFFVWLIVVGVLFGILDGAGIISKINDTITTINGAGSTAPIRAGVVFGGAAIIGVVNIVLFIALSTVGSVVYNLCADLVGGIEITLSER